MSAPRASGVLLLLLGGAAALLVACGEDGCPPPPCGVRRGTVAWVKDGDTFAMYAACARDDECFEEGTCGADGRCSVTITVRLAGTGAAETGEAGDLARDASDELELLIGGGDVRLVFDPVFGCRDSVERHLAYVFREEDGLFVQEELIRKGLACAYWWEYEPGREPPLYYERLTNLSDELFRARVGVWSAVGTGDDACDGITGNCLGECARLTDPEP